MDRKVVIFSAILMAAMIVSMAVTPALAGKTIPYSTRIARESVSPEGDGIYGTSVAIGGGYIAVGAPNENSYDGRVYVYTVNGVLKATLTSPTAGSGYGEGFGENVAISGGYLVVGAPWDSDGTVEGAGQVYVYTLSSLTGTPTPTTLSSQNPEANGAFGHSIGTDGKHIIVGAPYETVGTNTNVGRAYVYTMDGTYVSTLNSQNPIEYGYFGSSSAIDGNYVAVGAVGEATAPHVWEGLVYIFTTSGTLVSTLESRNPETDGDFGFSVAISGRNLVVGAPRERAACKNGGAGAGNAYIFTVSGRFVKNMTSPSQSNFNEFGYSVATDGKRIIIGARQNPIYDPNTIYDAGCAYVFSMTGKLVSSLVSAYPLYQGCFGCSVAISGGYAVVGASAETVGSNLRAGHAYIFS